MFTAVCYCQVPSLITVYRMTHWQPTAPQPVVIHYVRLQLRVGERGERQPPAHAMVMNLPGVNCR